MMDWLGRKSANDQMIQIGEMIDESVADHLKDGKNLTYDLGGDSSCSFVGESISSRLAAKLAEQF
jgi:isocitrate/isopropylmalate dehydrogenase